MVAIFAKEDCGKLIEAICVVISTAKDRIIVITATVVADDIDVDVRSFLLFSF